MIYHKREFNGRKLHDASFEIQELVEGPTRKVTWRYGYDAREWYGTESTKEYTDVMRAGAWPAAVKKFRSMLEQLPRVDRAATQNMRMRRKRTKGDFGNELDIHAVRQGRIDRAWDKMEHSPKWSVQNKLIHVYVNMRTSAMTHADELMWRAAAVYRVVEGLTAAGYSVAVTAARFGSGEDMNDHSAYSIHSVQVKGYGQHVTDDRLAMILHGAFYRHYLLDVGRWMIPGYEPSLSGLYSSSGDVLPLHVEEERQKGAQVVRIGEECTGREGALRTIERVITELNAKSVEE